MSDTLTKKLEQVREALKEPITSPEQESEMPEEATAATEAAPKKKTAAKKATKKVVKKAAAPKAKTDQVTLVDLAKRAKMAPQRARQKLREAEVERDGRWSWDKGSRSLKAAEKALGL